MKTVEINFLCFIVAIEKKYHAVSKHKNRYCEENDSYLNHGFRELEVPIEKEVSVEKFHGFIA